MGFYADHKQEILTVQLLSQMLGKVKLGYAPQEPQWGHVLLDLTATGFSTGLLRFNDLFFSMELDLIEDEIRIQAGPDRRAIALEDGTTIKDYYEAIFEAAQDIGLFLEINPKPQEMSTTTAFDEITEPSSYKPDVARELLEWFQLAYQVEQIFMGPMRKRKVGPGLFFGTFDVSGILVDDQYEPFPDDSKVIERGAFDEHMVEFGFWLGDDHNEHPTFFILPYPFISKSKLEVSDDFPEGSVFNADMAEYLLPIEGKASEADLQSIVQFFRAGFKKAYEHLG